jgi:hypothetical protein
MEKKKSGFGFIIFLLILSIVVDCVIIYCNFALNQTVRDQIVEISKLSFRITEAQNQFKEYQEKVSNALVETEEQETLKEEVKENESKSEEVSTKKEFEKVVLDGCYGLPNSDASSEDFTKDGKVSTVNELGDPEDYTRGVEEKIGIYKTIAPNIVEINYTKKRENNQGSYGPVEDIDEHLYIFVNNDKIFWLNNYLGEHVLGYEKIGEEHYIDFE